MNIPPPMCLQLFLNLWQRLSCPDLMIADSLPAICRWINLLNSAMISWLHSSLMAWALDGLLFSRYNVFSLSGSWVQKCSSKTDSNKKKKEKNWTAARCTEIKTLLTAAIQHSTCCVCLEVQTQRAEQKIFVPFVQESTWVGGAIIKRGVPFGAVQTFLQLFKSA